MVNQCYGCRQAPKEVKLDTHLRSTVAADPSDLINMPFSACIYAYTEQIKLFHFFCI